MVVEEKLSGMIHTLRGVPVMLDRDLADNGGLLQRLDTLEKRQFTHEMVGPS